MEWATSFNVTETGAELVSDLVVLEPVSVVWVLEFTSLSLANQNRRLITAQQSEQKRELRKAISFS